MMPAAMGQPITVVEKPTPRPGIARFETNRWLTGMGHERYASAADVLDDRAVDELARRLFATGGVRSVHVSGSMITVELAEGWTGDRLLDVIRNLHVHYPGPDGTDAAGTPGTSEAAGTSETAGTSGAGTAADTPV
jgi:hypothetical protein